MGEMDTGRECMPHGMKVGIFHVTEKRLVDQKNNIIKRKWLLDLELEEIQRNIEYIGNGKLGLESNENEG